MNPYAPLHRTLDTIGQRLDVTAGELRAANARAGAGNARARARILELDAEEARLRMGAPTCCGGKPMWHTPPREDHDEPFLRCWVCLKTREVEEPERFCEATGPLEKYP